VTSGSQTEPTTSNGRTRNSSVPIAERADRRAWPAGIDRDIMTADWRWVLDDGSLP
jgi:hypothetical protein